MTNYFALLVSLIAIQLMSAHALVLTLCLARVFNLAHVALLGLGAYGAGIFALRYDTPFVVCLLIGAALPALLAALISLMALRRRGDQVVLLTLGLNVLMLAIFSNARDLAGGASGLVGVPVPRIASYSLESPVEFAVFSLTICSLCLYLLWLFRRSRYGLALVSQGEFPIAAEALGIDPSRLKRLALMLSGALVGLAGALSAFRLGIVAPGSFGFPELSLLLMIVILGGAGSFWGTTFSTVVLCLAPELLRLLPFWQSLGSHSGASIQLINALVIYLILRKFASSYFEQAREYA